ncbi:hypothetical protein [Streptomyces phytophilus]|uniref:hypothetical protein n=1 Tax=Streptomyces phytophilus TaxID=722715 RepID=UPI0015F0B25A|nr:hypothetical protein [Streptomyces phytophilus]
MTTKSKGDGRFIRTPENARQDARAAELRAEGLSYQQIADELDLGNKGSAHRAVRRALRDIAEKPAQAVRDLELRRLDAMYEAVMEVLERRHVTVSHGKVIVDDGGEPLLDDSPVLQAVDRLLKIQARRAALLGLDAETKVNLSGGVTYEIVAVDPEALK